ncbi:MAG TPA: DUF4279 domain-containing protein [Candidatus Dormibacteraeota bacterium]|nr:DUF4279 domain-containing protein [Candidatus Dormibacteraeota bacterium]
MSEEGKNENVGALPSVAPDEQEGKIYFKYSATLRIFGAIPSFDEITQRLGIAPTETHRKGERGWGPRLPAYEHDMWSYDPPVKETEPLHVHIDTLWDTLKERKEYLLELKQNLKVDVFLGYQSNCDHAGVEVPYQSLEMFRELRIPFGLSIIVV